jgi:hypothetical protein
MKNRLTISQVLIFCIVFTQVFGGFENQVSAATQITKKQVWFRCVLTLPPTQLVRRKTIVVSVVLKIKCLQQRRVPKNQVWFRCVLTLPTTQLVRRKTIVVAKVL